MKETVFTSPSDDPLKEAQAQYSVFVKDIGKIAQGDRRPYVADGVKRIVESISSLLKKAKKDASALENDSTGDPNDLSVAARDACMISAQARLYYLKNLFVNFGTVQKPQTSREISLKMKQINDLLTYAGAEAKSYELDPNEKITNENFVAEVGFSANRRSGLLMLKKFIDTSQGEKAYGVTDSVFLALDALGRNYSAANNLTKKYNLSSMPSLENEMRDEFIQTLATIYLQAEQDEVWDTYKTSWLPENGKRPNIEDKDMPPGVLRKRYQFCKAVQENPFFSSEQGHEEPMKRILIPIPIQLK